MPVTLRCLGRSDVSQTDVRKALLLKADHGYFAFPSAFFNIAAMENPFFFLSVSEGSCFDFDQPSYDQPVVSV